MKRIILFVFIVFIGSVIIAQNDPKKHIFKSDRLVMLKDTEITGIVTYIHAELDGDYHIRLKTSDKLILSSNNYSKQDSCLILEIICAHKTIFPMSCSCKGYMNKITIPKINDKITVSGVLVFDKTHELTEIHPVISLQIIN